jgi:OOP family OmpA-OmpF porin
LTGESKSLLDSVAVSLRKVADARIEIAGHTDSVGNDGYNMKLSQRRADSVRDYLIQQGVDGARLTARGYGETQPLADNATADGRARNRRVVLRKL